MKKDVSVKIDAELYAKVRALKDATGIPIKRLIENAINEIQEIRPKKQKR
jgi:predicted transcriptional regulator